MKKIMILLACAAMLVTGCLAADYTVTRLVSDAVVEEDGGSQMTQTVELNITSAVDEIVIPAGTDAKKVSVSGVKSKTFRKDGTTYVRLLPDEGFTGNIKAVVSYRVDGVVETTENGQHFTLELVGAMWDVAVERYAFSVVLPKESAAQPGFFSGYSADEVEDYLTVAVEGRAISGQKRGGLLDRESFTMKMDVAEGFFSGVSGTSQRKNGAVSQWICGISGLLVTAAAGYYWFRFLRSGRLRVQARTTAPESLTPAEVPYLLCGAKPDFALLVCHWGALGYLTITVNSAGRVLLRKSMDMGTERREEERKLFALLFGESDVCEAGGSRYKRASEIGSGVLRQYWVRRLFDRNSGSPLILRGAAVLVSALAMLNTMAILLPASGVKWLLLLTAFVAGGACGAAVVHGCVRLAVKDRVYAGVGTGALLLQFLVARLGGGMYLMLLALVLSVFAGFMTRNGGRRTASGSDVVEQTMGFCRFLGHAEDHHLVQSCQRDGQYFYNRMLYAAACGQGRAFARRFGDMELESCAYLTFSGKTPGQAAAFYAKFEQLLKLLKG